MDKKDKLMAECRDLFNKLAWLNNLEMKDERFGDFKSSEVHCIEYIGKNPETNVTQLAQAFYMTRGAISKLTKRLMDKGALESYQKPDNKKEVYFRLTDRGATVFHVHEQMHSRFGDRDKAVFESVTEEQFDMMLELVARYHSHLDLEVKKLNLDLESN